MIAHLLILLIAHFVSRETIGFTLENSRTILGLA